MTTGGGHEQSVFKRLRVHRAHYKRRLLLNLLGILAVGLLQTLIAGFVSWHLYSARLVDRYRQIEAENLRVVQNYNSRIFQELEGLFAFAADSDMRYFADNAFADDIVRFYRFQSRVEAALTNSSYIDSIYFYSVTHDYGIAIDRGGSTTGTKPFGELRADSGTSGSFGDVAWVDDLEPERYYQVFYRSDYLGDEEAISVIVPARGFRGGSTAVLVANVRFDSIISSTKAATNRDDQTVLMVLGTEIIPLVRPRPMILDYVDAFEAIPPGGSLEASIDGTPYILSATTQSVLDANYVSALEFEAVTRELRGFLGVYSLTILFILAVFLTLGLIYVVWLYRPVSALMRSISVGDAGASQHWNAGEIAIIQKAINDLSNSRRDLLDKLEGSRSAARDQALFDLFRGRRSQDKTRVLEELGVESVPTCLRAAVVYQPVVPIEDETVRYVVGSERTERVLEALKSESSGFAVCARGAGETVDVMLFSASEVGDEAVEEYFLRARAKLRTVGAESSLVVGVGISVSDLDALSRSHESADRAAGRAILSEEEWIHFAQPQTEPRADHPVRLATMDEFSELLDNGDDKAISDFVARLMERVEDACADHVQAQAEYILEFTRAIDYLESRARIDAHVDLSGFTRTIVRCRTRGEVRAALNRHVSALVTKWRENQVAASSAERHAMSLIGLIEEHYADNLGLEQYAAMLGLNPSYLSRVFSQSTGTSFSEYLARVRIDRGVQLLKDTNEPIYAISQRIGFGSQLSFRRAFRKLIGRTPNEYRSMLGREADVSEAASDGVEP